MNNHNIFYTNPKQRSHFPTQCRIIFRSCSIDVHSFDCLQIKFHFVTFIQIQINHQLLILVEKKNFNFFILISNTFVEETYLKQKFLNNIYSFIQYLIFMPNFSQKGSQRALFVRLSLDLLTIAVKYNHSPKLNETTIYTFFLIIIFFYLQWIL